MKIGNLFMYVLGAIIALGFFVILGLMVYKPVPDSNSTLLNVMLGVLGGAFTTIVSYFYGSSKGSQEKTELLKNGNTKT